VTAPSSGTRGLAPGTVAVVGLGKIGLPLVAQFASAGWHVIGVDVLPEVVAAVGAGSSHIAEEPGLQERLAQAHADGRLEATTSHADAARRADVIVMVVPLMFKGDEPDYSHIDAATKAVAEGLRPGALVIYETTLPIGDTRNRFGPMLSAGLGRRQEPEGGGFHLAFSPERVFSGRVFSDLANYPKIVGGVDHESAVHATSFYESALSAEVRVLRNSESAEFAKLAETTYRDVNIALANEFARLADRVDVDVLEVIEAANSQPFSHIHQPGIGVGGHCIPVYPRFLLTNAPDLEVVAASRRINDHQVERVVDTIEHQLGSLAGTAALVLGVTYREGVRELANSRALPLIKLLKARGAFVSAYDPIMSADEIRSLGAIPYRWDEPSGAQVIVTQTADQKWRSLEFERFPRLDLIYDGRNILRDVEVPGDVVYLGVGRGTAQAK
jgi:nucleotide sugar dehydrogenase